MITVSAPCSAQRPRRRAATVQAGLLAFVLAVALLAPRPGQAVLIVPVIANSVRIPADVIVLRSGRIAGSILVWPRKTLPIGALLAQGLVPIAAPAWACGGEPLRNKD